MTSEKQTNLESELLKTILNSGVLEKHEEKNEEDDDSSNSDASENTKLERLRKKPDKLRAKLFEVILRKRIFLTDRMEKIEKILVDCGLVSDTDLANQ